MTRNLSAIVVNYNGNGVVKKSVEKLLEIQCIEEVIVVDNASTDGSVNQLEKLVVGGEGPRIIRNKKNLGFATAANQGIRDSKGKYLAIVNPDCFAEEETVVRLIGLLEKDSEVGMVGCRVLGEDGIEQKGSRRNFPTPKNSFKHLFGLERKEDSKTPSKSTYDLHKTLPPTEPIQVEAISGAFMLVSKKAMEKVGLMDEEYFLHCEDLDWCKRFKDSGYRVMYVPDVSVVHVKGFSSRKGKIRVEYHKHRGMLRFYRKFYKESYSWIFNTMIVFGVWVHFAIIVPASAFQKN